MSAKCDRTQNLRFRHDGVVERLGLQVGPYLEDSCLQNCVLSYKKSALISSSFFAFQPVPKLSYKAAAS